MLSDTQKSKIKSAFKAGNLKVRSISPSGTIEWRRVLKAHRMPTSWETIVKVETTDGPMVLTGGHSVYLNPTEVKPAEDLVAGDTVLAFQQDYVSKAKVTRVTDQLNRPYMYDLTVEGNHNLFLGKSGVCVSNCPDKHYHFRPPTSSGTVNEFNRVFAYIWEDEELLEYMQQAVFAINASPPETHFRSLDEMVKAKPNWRHWILTGGMVHACIALALNWIADEFDYSIGGISLSIEKSSKYEGIKQNAEGRFDKMMESKSRTVKIMRGLRQSRYGLGVRSSFGPVTGRGVLTPRKFMGI